jgi:hypothetical protein
VSGEYLSGTFTVKSGLKQGDVSSSWLYNFALEHVFTKVQANHEVLKLNGANQISVHADDIDRVIAHNYTEKHTSFNIH